jgi:glutamate racemase
MKKAQKELPIGVFDSGVGGVSVLAEMVRQLPQEQYIYYADSKNAPYGTQPLEQVRELTLKVVDFLCTKGIKALVVACNTATSVAVQELRAKLPIPVIGMEPAVKPAVAVGHGGKILVLATPLTLSQQKFNLLLHRFEDQAEIIPLPCPGLVELIEKGHPKGDLINQCLLGLFEGLELPKLSAVVLGCTHYVFVRQAIARLTGPGVEIIDGNCGTVKHLANTLAQEGLLLDVQRGSGLTAKRHLEDNIQFYTSDKPEEVIPLCQNLLVNRLKSN